MKALVQNVACNRAKFRYYAGMPCGYNRNAEAKRQHNKQANQYSNYAVLFHGLTHSFLYEMVYVNGLCGP